MTVSATPAAPIQEEPVRLQRAMGFRDLVLFYLVTGFTVRWIGTAASAGPSAAGHRHPSPAGLHEGH